MLIRLVDKPEYLPVQSGGIETISLKTAAGQTIEAREFEPFVKA
jgi:hypothetical protein